MNPEEIYKEHLRTIERIAMCVAHRNHLAPDDAGEFTQEVRVRLLDDEYAVIRKFEGRSSFSTYLTTVITRLYHQWRIEQWGKWRPSAEAKRLGEKAIVLEKLITRDGFTVAEAMEMLTTRSGSAYDAAELEAIYDRLPLRIPRPVLISDENCAETIAVGPDADDRIESRDRERAASVTARAMDAMLAGMDAEDRLILQLRFWHQRKVPDIARTLHLDQKKLYKRLDKLFGVLRRGLEHAGVTKNEVGDLLRRGDQEIRLKSFSAAEIGRLRPSHRSGAESQNYKGNRNDGSRCDDELPDDRDAGGLR